MPIISISRDDSFEFKKEEIDDKETPSELEKFEDSFKRSELIANAETDSILKQSEFHPSPAYNINEPGPKGRTVA